MPVPTPENIQGLITQRYAYPLARHFLLRVTDPAAARDCMRTLLPRVTRASIDLAQRPEPLLNIGITWIGLKILFPALYFTGADAEFPADFRDNPPPPIAGTWHGRFTGADVHLVLSVHCRTEAGLLAASVMVRQEIALGFWELPANSDGDKAITARSLGGRKLHFGYMDGISEPDVNWSDVPDQPDLVDMRQFLLGYWSNDLQSFPSVGRWADFVRDGSYGAFQWIRQDVASFEQYLSTNAAQVAPGLPLAEAREWLASRMMGRWRDGTPVALSPDRRDPKLAMANAFQYADDPAGLHCPLTAHVRLANPRDMPLRDLVKLSVPKGGPRLLRRGLPYGPELAGEINDGVDRGLVGLFLCANLTAQFFTITSWINKADFSPAFSVRRLRWQDMLMGDRTMPGASTAGAVTRGDAGTEVEVLLPALPQLLEWHGTLLLLFPGLTGLAEIAHAS